MKQTEQDKSSFKSFFQAFHYRTNIFFKVLSEIPGKSKQIFPGKVDKCLADPWCTCRDGAGGAIAPWILGILKS